MEFNLVLEALMEGKVSHDEFENLAVAFGIQNDPFVSSILDNLAVQEQFPDTSALMEWAPEDAESLLETLKSPKSENQDFPLWSPNFERAVIDVTGNMSASVECGDETVHFETWSPNFERAVLDVEDSISASLACIKDGEFRSGKTFYCARCNFRCKGYDEFARHRSNHNLSASELPSTSGERHRSRALELPSTSETINESLPPVNEQVGGGEESPYKIELTGTRRFAKATAIEKTYKVRFDDQWQGQRLDDLRQHFHRLFEDLLARARDGINDNDLLRVVIRHQSLNHAIVIPLQAAEDMSVDKILSKVEAVLQSEENLSIDDSFQVIVGALHIPQGAGRSRMIKLSGPDNSIHKKSSMVQIVNDDLLCMARAIGVCLAKHCVVPDETWKIARMENRFLTNPEILAKHNQCSILGYKNIRNKNRQEQKQLAILLCQKAGVPTDRPGSLNDLPSFEEALGVRIAVVAASLGNKFLRVPDNVHEEWPLLYLYLLDHEGISHFHSIVNISGFFSAIYFCERCFRQYSTNTKHRCETTCLTCKSQNCPETDITMSCRSCHMVCRSPDCYERHLLKRTRKNGDKGDITLSQCDEFWRCTICKKVVNRFKRPVELHDCGEWMCKCCKSWVKGEHRCFLFPEEPKGTVKKFIFFDFEATQDTLAQCTEGYLPGDSAKCQRCFESWCGQPRHVPNFVVAQTVCVECEDEKLTADSKCDGCGSRCSKCDAWDKESKSFVHPPCPYTCGSREVIFQGDSTLNEFGSWLFSPQHKDATVLAHNMKAYDGVFLLEYLVNNSMRPSKVIYNGSKIMYMEVSKGLHIRVLDSLNFLPMKLADLPKTFGLTELCKGYFPHFFNKRENQQYVGSYPDTEAYGVDFMSTKDRPTFLQWHQSKQAEIFDFRAEMEAYCRSDVDILRRACLQFRQLLLNATDVDPFQYVTIASVCMGIFKTRFLEADYRATFEFPCGLTYNGVKARKSPEGWFRLIDTGSDVKVDEGAKVSEKKAIRSDIAQVPAEGYVRKDNFSKASIQWLEFEMELARRKGESLEIKHALNGGEEFIFGTRYKVDGRSGNTVYEFHGCLWHGCPECYPDRTVKNPKTGQTMDQLYALTLIKKKVLINDFRFNYVCIWEHDWTRKIQEDSEVRDFVATLDIHERMDPRESFFGGRTNASRLKYKALPNEQIKYVDFTSLYPYVNKYSRYPVGHPHIITSDFEDISAYFGIAKVKILAPRGLYHPVLPYSSNDKLKFPLCRTCADQESNKSCQHTTEERAFVGSWCSPEIEMALSKGYTILKIYEIYHWEESTQSTKQGGLFATYVNTFLKFKQEASGWPEWCDTDEQKDKYVRDYFQNEGVQLDPNNIKKNPGLRALSKLCLNSFWGKFGQRLNQGVCEFIEGSQMDKFYKLLTDRSKKMKDFHIISENHLHLDYEHQFGFVPEDMKTNIFLATFTTCWARLKLYGVLDQLGTRVLYYDTDSIIFVSRPGQFEPPLGDYLGELTDELDPGDYILELVSGGPKNYAYRTAMGKQTCKIRGFSLNYNNGKILNFDAVLAMVGQVDPTQPHTYKKVKKGHKKRKRGDADEPLSKCVILTNPTKICRDKYANCVFNRKEDKKYRVIYNKRVIQKNFDTLPYGY